MLTILMEEITLLWGTTTPISCRKAGAAALTPRACRNGSRPNGSTLSSGRSSTPESDS